MNLSGVLPEKKEEDGSRHTEEDGYQDPDKKTLIDFEWLLYVGLSIGLTEKQVGQLEYWKMVSLMTSWKRHHNMIIKKMIWNLD